MGYLVASFSRRTDLPSVITRLFTGGARWSHCGIVVGDSIIEAQMGAGVVATPLEQWGMRYPSVETVHIACPNATAAQSFALAQVGKPYDYLGAFGVPWRSEWHDPGKWYCSELLEAALAAGGRQRWRLEKHGVSPMESWNVL